MLLYISIRPEERRSWASGYVNFLFYFNPGRTVNSFDKSPTVDFYQFLTRNVLCGPLYLVVTQIHIINYYDFS